MLKMQVYLPDELHAAVKANRLGASKLLQDAAVWTVGREPPRGRTKADPTVGMTTIVLDSGGLSALADSRRGARVRARLDAGIWPPVVPSIVLVESLTGTARDASINHLLKACEIVEDLPRWLVRRAARLRPMARLVIASGCGQFRKYGETTTHCCLRLRSIPLHGNPG